MRPHNPPDSVNDRARDVIAILLLRDLAEATGSPPLPEIRAAGVALFEARAQEARQFGLLTRSWPPTVTGHRHWGDDFARCQIRQRRAIA